VPWLLNKAVNFLNRNQRRAGVDIVRVAAARAGDDLSDVEPGGVFEDPLIIDLVMTEGGWWERFVAERGPLLPDDEALLATSWLLVQRSVYEVLRTSPGVGMTIKDLRTGDDVEISERTFSKQAQPGLLVCARAVPDGRGHQFVGGIFPVRVGHEAAVLDLLDKASAVDIAAWAAAVQAPPKMATREGERMVICQAVLRVRNAQAAGRVLDKLYERDDDDKSTWREMFDLNEDERVARCTFHLDGDRLTIETMSEERLERALLVLKKQLPGARVLTDERQPFDLAKGVAPAPLAPSVGDSGPAPMVPPEVVAQLQEKFEKRWCDEQVPALAGLTPRQAAADPSRREALERLLAEFERDEAEPAPPGAFVGMRTARLRQLLGLSAG